MQTIFNILDKRFLKCTFPHFWLTLNDFIIWLPSSTAVTEQPGQLPFFLVLWRTVQFLFFWVDHFYWLQISSVPCQFEKVSASFSLSPEVLS